VAADYQVRFPALAETWLAQACVPLRASAADPPVAFRQEPAGKGRPEGSPSQENRNPSAAPLLPTRHDAPPETKPPGPGQLPAELAFLRPPQAPDELGRLGGYLGKMVTLYITSLFT
jgi:hypothetical protein